MTNLPGTDLPPRGTPSWFTPFSTAWDALRAFVKGHDDLVTTGRLSSLALAPTVRTWQPQTDYTTGDRRVSPSGELVVASSNHTSGATYDATKWTRPGSLGRVLALGTSIAVYPSSGATSTANTYPARVAAQLQTLLGQTYEVIAAGVSGNTTTEMLARLPGLLATHRPTVVTIETSVNDTRLDRSITTADTVLNMRKMAALVRLSGGTPIFITSTPFDPGRFGSASYDFTSTAKAVATNAAVVAMAAEQGVAVVDMFKAMLGKVGVLNDGLHPNDAGHVIWGAQIAAKIAAMVAADPKTVRALDEFDRADSATDLGSAAIGGAWQILRGVWGIVSGGAENTNGTNIQYALAVLNVGVTDVYAETRFVGSAGAGLAVRVTDNDNYYLAEIGADKKLRIFKRIAGAFTTLFTSASAFTTADGDKFAVMVDGGRLAVFLRDVAIASVADASITTGSLAGMWNGGADYATNREKFARFQATT